MSSQAKLGTFHRRIPRQKTVYSLLKRTPSKPVPINTEQISGGKGGGGGKKEKKRNNLMHTLSKNMYFGCIRKKISGSGSRRSVPASITDTSALKQHSGFPKIAFHLLF